MLMVRGIVDWLGGPLFSSRGWVFGNDKARIYEALFPKAIPQMKLRDDGEVIPFDAPESVVGVH